MTWKYVEVDFDDIKSIKRAERLKRNYEKNGYKLIAESIGKVKILNQGTLVYEKVKNG